MREHGDSIGLAPCELFPTARHLVCVVATACDSASATCEKLAQMMAPELAEQLAEQGREITRAANCARLSLLREQRAV